MARPKIINHMHTGIDGKINGPHLNTEESHRSQQEYYELFLGDQAYYNKHRSQMGLVVLNPYLNQALGGVSRDCSSLFFGFKSLIPIFSSLLIVRVHNTFENTDIMRINHCK